MTEEFILNADFSEIEGISHEDIDNEALESAAAADKGAGGDFIREPGAYVLELISLDDMKQSKNDPNWAQCKAVFKDTETGKIFKDNWIPIPQGGTLSYKTQSGKKPFCAFEKLCKFLNGLGYGDIAIEKPSSEVTSADKKKMLKNLATALREVFGGNGAVGSRVKTKLAFEGWHIKTEEDGTLTLRDGGGKQHPQSKGKTFKKKEEIEMFMAKKKLTKVIENKDGEKEERADLSSLVAKFYHPFKEESAEEKPKVTKEDLEKKREARKAKAEKPAPAPVEEDEDDEIPTDDELVSADGDDFDFDE